MSDPPRGRRQIDAHPFAELKSDPVVARSVVFDGAVHGPLLPLLASVKAPLLLRADPAFGGLLNVWTLKAFPQHQLTEFPWRTTSSGPNRQYHLACVR